MLNCAKAEVAASVASATRYLIVMKHLNDYYEIKLMKMIEL